MENVDTKKKEGVNLENAQSVKDRQHLKKKNRENNASQNWDALFFCSFHIFTRKGVR